MPEYVVDTWFFIATLDRFDSHHRTAQQLKTRYRQRLITHDGVLTEMLAYFSRRGRAARVEAVRIARDAVLEMPVIPADRRVNQ